MKGTMGYGMDMGACDTRSIWRSSTESQWWLSLTSRTGYNLHSYEPNIGQYWVDTGGMQGRTPDAVVVIQVSVLKTATSSSRSSSNSI